MDTKPLPDIERITQGIRALECICDLTACGEDLHLVTSQELCALLRIVCEHLRGALPPQ